MSRNWAITIGINNYTPTNFRPLKYAKRDAEAVRDFFENEAGFDQVCFFSDDSPHFVSPNGDNISTYPSVGNLFSFLQDRFEKPFLNKGDNCWFFFAGHGLQYQNRDYLMPIDAPNPRGKEPAYAISVSYVRERLSHSGADNVILLLDACRDEGSRASARPEWETQQGIITISACSPLQKSWEIDSLQQGAFTYALLEALRMPGERNCATVERLDNYLRYRVPQLCRDHGKIPEQVPRIAADPAEKLHFILLPKYATQADISVLKNDAYRFAFVEHNLDFAEQLCIRANAAAMGRDMEILKLYGRLEQLKSQTPQPASQTTNITSNLGSRSNTLQVEPKQGSFKKSSINPDPDNQDISTFKHEDNKIQKKQKHVFSSISIPGASSFEFHVIEISAEGDEINRYPETAQQLIEDLGNEVNLEMVAIPGGTFLMGALESELKQYANESPAHFVEVRPFLMSKHLITQTQWKAVASLPMVSQKLRLRPSNFRGANYPVEQISWHDAIEFCTRLSHKIGYSYRLPTEAEWEFACRAGTITPFHFGETIIPNLANYDGNYVYRSGSKGINRGKTTPVDYFEFANAFGLFDMHGNLWEWCQDHWHENYKGAPQTADVWIDGQDNLHRVLRGGSWRNEPLRCRSAYRWYKKENEAFNHIGFRVVRDF